MKITTGLIAVIVFGFVAVITLIAYVSITGHDAVQFVTNIGGLLTALAGFIVLILSIQKQGTTIDTIKTQTNGTLTKLTSQLSFALAKLDPAHAEEVLNAGNELAPVAPVTLLTVTTPAPTPIAAPVVPEPAPVAPVPTPAPLFVPPPTYFEPAPIATTPVDSNLIVSNN